jgi:hypothetical protein
MSGTAVPLPFLLHIYLSQILFYFIYQFKLLFYTYCNVVCITVGNVNDDVWANVEINQPCQAIILPVNVEENSIICLI